MEWLVRQIGALIPFVSPYPFWVKGALAASILFGAVFVVGLFIANPTPTPNKERAQSSGAWLEIHGVNAFGALSGTSIRIIAYVNGTEFVYPSSVPGVTWAEVGPTMAMQRYQLPLRDTYHVKFEAFVQGGMQGDEKRYASVEEQLVQKETDGISSYELHAVARMTRAAAVSAEIRYAIVRR